MEYPGSGPYGGQFPPRDPDPVTGYPGYDTEPAPGYDPGYNHGTAHGWPPGPDYPSSYDQAGYPGGYATPQSDYVPLPYGDLSDRAPATRKNPGRSRFVVGVGIVSVTLVAPILWIVPVVLVIMEALRPDSDRSPWKVADGFFRIAGLISIWSLILVVSVAVGFLALGVAILA